MTTLPTTKIEVSKWCLAFIEKRQRSCNEVVDVWTVVTDGTECNTGKPSPGDASASRLTRFSPARSAPHGYRRCVSVDPSLVIGAVMQVS